MKEPIDARLEKNLQTVKIVIPIAKETIKAAKQREASEKTGSKAMFPEGTLEKFQKLNESSREEETTEEMEIV